MKSGSIKSANRKLKGNLQKEKNELIKEHNEKERHLNASLSKTAKKVYSGVSRAGLEGFFQVG